MTTRNPETCLYLRVLHVLWRVTLPGACLLFAACARAPFSTAQEINEECRLEMEAARTAVQLREQGKPQVQLAAMLPVLQADSSRLLWQMHVILEESFAYPEFNTVTYSTYRFQHCMLDLQHKPVPRHMREVRAGLLACQAEHGDKASVAGTQCIIAAFPQAN